MVQMSVMVAPRNPLTVKPDVTFRTVTPEWNLLHHMISPPRCKPNLTGAVHDRITRVTCDFMHLISTMPP